ncbi:Pol protein [Phytophthora palmivora]|uniref:Pol protein n=1 Tax=Phytophthora palmivora TaxID=4796 RepID=A0A2P4XW04_9STRA|nr:Pol protein [Phytophthora palmivora]
MVIGRELMAAMGLVMDFRVGIAQWDGSEKKNNTREDAIPKSTACGLVEIAEDEKDELFAEQELSDDANLELFDEYFDFYNGRLARLRSASNSHYIPSVSRHYSIARSHEEVDRREIHCLVQLDVVEQIYVSEAAAPAFFRMKPSGVLQLLVDLRHLNRQLR